MPALDSKLRSQLDDVCQKAREVAEAAARSALQKRAVDVAEPFSHFGPKDKELRNRLRARGRQVGDVRNADGTQSIEQLSQELAYEYWHRMLFARFLTENHLLMHPDGVAVSLDECDALAIEADPPAPNGFVLAARYASRMLPEIFRTDDVLLEIEFAQEQRLPLEKMLASLPKQTFEADDSLGWVYQFWQTAEKKRVNDTGDKIDGRTLPAVTQLFTEHYMVEFLLHNTIGAWWCARHGIQGPPGSAGVPTGKSPIELPFLRWRDDGTPAAGKFESWPKKLAEFTMLDPCCGSGHFLVAAFNLLVPLRMHDEGLAADQACEAVLRDNLCGLELDPRCTQIAAFSLALAAWKYPESGDYRPLPAINIACSGQSVTGKKDEWLALAKGDSRLLEGMERLFDLFRNAPELGSLIDPSCDAGDLIAAGFSELEPLLHKALSQEQSRANADTLAVGVAAQGIAKAASLLAKSYTLTATNVPYLARSKHSETIYAFCEDHHDDAKADLATVCLDRFLGFARGRGAVAVVTPQNWLFLKRYKPIRSKLLKSMVWHTVVRLGPGAFETISGEVVKASLLIASQGKDSGTNEFSGLDVSAESSSQAKSTGLKTHTLGKMSQAQQIANPDSIVKMGGSAEEVLVGEYAMVRGGITTGDSPYFRKCFWELPKLVGNWARLQLGSETDAAYCGREHILLWENGEGEIAARTGGLGATIAGREVWGKKGIAINYTGALRATMYTGEIFENVICVLVPSDQKLLPALWHFCRSDEFIPAVRSVNQKLSVDVRYFEKTPIDLARWQAIADEEGPPPKPHSDDPTQWLFKGEIDTSTDPLQVAVARLLGYRWPDQPNAPDNIDKLADSDGIVCIPGVRGDKAAAERLLEILHAAYSKSWSDSMLHELLTAVGCKAGTTLEEWLRNSFFEQHYKGFHNRPFVWHIWDGRKDGFAALLNYHKLNHTTLDNVANSYLRDWIKEQSHDAKVGKPGADLRLAAAEGLQKKLGLILGGEPPYDIFVRWKPLHEQPIGWHPDLNDGVRMNIRPFIEAEILRKEPNIKWTKDRGTEPERDKHDYPWFWSGQEFVGARVNDVHLTNAEKTAARTRKKGAK
jgi:hypothetical protein